MIKGKGYEQYQQHEGAKHMNLLKNTSMAFYSEDNTIPLIRNPEAGALLK